MTPTLRPNTSDHAIWLNINENNEYRLPDDMTDWIVMDIGAHIGAFTHACRERGASFVYAYEPHPENAELFRKNIDDIYRVSLSQLALSGSSHLGYSRDGALSNFTGTTDEINTGSSSICLEDATAISCYVKSFDREVFDILRRHKVFYIDLIKMDCEGSEFDILLGSCLIDCARIYCGEFHEFNNHQITEVKEVLKPLQYSFDYFRHPDSNLGMFFAERKY